MDTLLNLLFAFVAGGIGSIPFIIPLVWLYREDKKIEARLAEKAWRASGRIIDVEAVEVVARRIPVPANTPKVSGNNPP